MSVPVSFGTAAARLVGVGRKRKDDPDNPTDPVLSYSWDVDDARAKPGRPIGDGSSRQGWAFSDALIRTFKHLYVKHRDEDYDGAYRVQATFVLALEAALGFLDFRTGDFYVAQQTIADRIGQSRSTVVRAIECAEHHGLLCHVRRSVKVDGAEGQARPQRQQASNGYFFDCEKRMKPELWAVFWGKLMANLKRVDAIAVRAATCVKRAFNSLAQPAPRRAGKELAMLLEELREAVWKNTAQEQSPSP